MTSSIDNRKQEIVDRYGDWTAHNIHLGGDVYTISNNIRGDELLARRVLQIVSDVLNRPLNEIRVLDLACLEGLYAVEFARHGARVVGIEIRESHIQKARFAKEVLELENLVLEQDDVRNLSAEKYGLFEAVLCLGILYHLDAPDVFEFVERMGQVCRGCLVIDTHISTTNEVSHIFRDKVYAGKLYREHGATDTPEEKAKRPWASIDNPGSFWLTRSSLYNLLAHAGFTSVYECHNPPFRHTSDRVTLLAIKGKCQKVISSPALSDLPLADWVEEDLTGGRTWDSIPGPPVDRVSLARTIGRRLPEPVKAVIKKIVR
jgi:2-polyprenyl-3-methyl-5-hydroxy-6-metoxy-1,4-benzoquinol methylase